MREEQLAKALNKLGKLIHPELSDFDKQFTVSFISHFPADAELNIAGRLFIAHFEKNVSTTNLPIVLQKHWEIKRDIESPCILVSEYITDSVGDKLRSEGIQYLDEAGNAFIRQGKLLIFIKGQKHTHRKEALSTKAFKQAGAKILFTLLSKPEMLHHSYRDIAEYSCVSLGSVSDFFQALDQMKFVGGRGKRKFFFNTNHLFERWLVAYQEEIIPKYEQIRFKLLDDRPEKLLGKKCFRYEQTLLGAEPAADLLTHYLKPAEWIIYTKQPFFDLAREIRALPHPEGQLVFRKPFWKDLEMYNNLPVVHPLLIYADLIASSDPRNREIANLIKNEHLNF
jgi:hypothetical protein